MSAQTEKKAPEDERKIQEITANILALLMSGFINIRCWFMGGGLTSLNMIVTLFDHLLLVYA